MASLKEYRLEQLAKLENLQALGIDPYPASSQRDLILKDVAAKFSELTGQFKWLVGRLMAQREHGQIIFWDIADQDASLQLILRPENLTTDDQQAGYLGYQDLNLLTRGDFINVYGMITKSQTGEVSLEVKRLKLLSKVLRPLPQALDDTETRRRRRYLDLAINPSVRERFMRRSRFWQSVRDYLNQRGFWEVNLPILESTVGGGEAQPFKTHMQALDTEFYLRISHELPLKRLLGGGYEKVFDIGARFRNEGYSDEHLPEHIAMEWYWAYADWCQGMKFMEAMFAEVCQQTFDRQDFEFRGQIVNFNQAWPELDYQAVMREHYKIDALQVDVETVNKCLRRVDLEVIEPQNLSTGIDRLWKNIRKDIAGPCWLVNPPILLAPLAKANPQKSGCAQRFWGIALGSEICTGFSELNDPQEQLIRFKAQQALRDQGNPEAQMLDIDFVEMLEYGMPPACGLGFSERVFWLLEGVPARDGVPFNHFRSEIDANTQEIYPELFNQAN